MRNSAHDRPQMNRRTVLKGTSGGIVGAIGIVPATIPTVATDTGSVDTKFHWEQLGCTSEDHAATIRCSGNTVVVDGAFITSTACDELALGEVRYDSGSDALTVVIEEVDGGLCVQCLGLAEYKLVAILEDRMDGECSSSPCEFGGEEVFSVNAGCSSNFRRRQQWRRKPRWRK